MSALAAGHLVKSHLRHNRSTAQFGAQPAATASAAALSVISGAEFASESTSTASSSATIIRSAFFEPFGHFLLRFDEQFQQIAHDVGVLVIEERSCETDVAYATGSADSVDVLVDVAWKIEVDHVTHVWNVKTSSCNLNNER